MKRDVDAASVSLLGRAGTPQRAPGWWARQAHLLGIARHVARLRSLAARIEKLATDAARRQELVVVEAEALDAVVASLRVRAVGLGVHARAGLLDSSDATTRAGTNASTKAGTN